MKIAATSLLTLSLIASAVGQDEAPRCFKNGFVLSDISECSFDAIFPAFEKQFEEAQYMGMACPHSAEQELLNHMGATDRDEADANLKKNVCMDGFDNYKNKLPYEIIAGYGEKFDNDYFQGGSIWNEQRATLYNKFDELVDEELYLLKEDAAHVRSFYDSQGRYGMVEFPESHVPSINECQHNSFYCCWPQDRQANDNNGNCATPYDDNCLDSDPADNTDLCYSATDEGMLIFPGEDGNNDRNAEGPIHCHGTAWANPETADPSWAFRGNNLFYVSMYDHMYQRGYVRNIEGKPMCGCTESMPVASRSDCTEMDVDLEMDFMYDGRSWSMELQKITIAFNACKGINRQGKNQNNDLWSYANRLHMEGLLDFDDMDAITKQLVGDQPNDGICRDAADSLMHQQGYSVGYAHDPETSIPLVGKGVMKLPQSEALIGPISQEFLLTSSDVFSTPYPILERVCAACYVTHQHIFYRRKTPINGVPIVDHLADSRGNDYGVFDTDFTLHSTYEDAVTGDNPWSCSNGYNYGAGFPGECSPSGAKVRHQAIRFSHGSHRTHGAWYLAGTNPFDLMTSHNIGGFRGISPGSAFKTNHTIYVTSTAFDIWETSDELQFVPMPVAKPDFVMTVKVDQLAHRDYWTKAGLMIRESLDPGAKNVFIHTTGGAQARFQSRKATDENTGSYGGNFNAVQEAAPLWLRLSKKQNEFIAYLSADGENWQQFDIPQYVDMDPANMVAGLALCSHHGGGAIAEAAFTDFKATAILSEGNYQSFSDSVDIGNAADAVGLAEVDETTSAYRISASGTDIWGKNDHFRFAYFQASGNFMIEALIANIDPHPHEWTKAGIMIRPTFSDNAPNAFNAMSAVKGAFGAFRLNADENTHLVGFKEEPLAFCYVRLTKIDQTITFERSFDGNTWDIFHLQTFDWATGNLYVGMAVTSHAHRIRATAIFENWQLIQLEDSKFIPRGGAQTTLLASSNIGGYRGGAPGMAFLTDEGAIHVASTGMDVINTADQLQFLPMNVEKPSFHMTVYIPEFSHSDQWSKAGLMIRESDEPGAKNVFFFISGIHGVFMTYRLGADQTTHSIGWGFEGIDEDPPLWLRLVKTNNEFIGYLSADGITWEAFGSPVYANFDQNTMMAGIAVTARSHHGNVAEATFTQFETAAVTGKNPGFVPVPSAQSTDIGNAQSQVGFAEYDPATNNYSVSGSGSDIWNSEDHFHFVHFEQTGNFVIEATVSSINPNPNYWTKAGVMIRETLDAGSPNAFNLLVLSRGVWGQYRDENGAVAQNVAGVPNVETSSASLRLTKYGTQIIYERSLDGSDWEVYEIKDASAWAGGSVYVGMAVTSHDQRKRATAMFENWKITPLTGNQYVLRNGVPSTLVDSTAIGTYLGGTPGTAFSDSTGKLHVVGSGSDIWNEADGCLLHKLAVPEPDFDIIINLESFIYRHHWSKAGIMIRESDDPGSKHVTFLLSGVHGVVLHTRTSTGDRSWNMGGHINGVDEEPPLWMRLVKFQNSFTAYLSLDGTEWELFLHPLYMNMQSIEAGITVSSQAHNGMMSTAVFSTISVSAYSDNSGYDFVKSVDSVDLGNAVNIPGYSEYEVASSTYRISGSGSDIWGVADGFHFTYFEAEGNFEIEARVTSIDPSPDYWTKAGIMIRNSLETGSINAFNLMTLARGPFGQIRPAFGEETTSYSIMCCEPFTSASLRLSRVDNVLTFARKFKGGEWEEYLVETWPGNEAVYVGMAVTSHRTNDRATAIFEDWKFTQL